MAILTGDLTVTGNLIVDGSISVDGVQVPTLGTNGKLPVSVIPALSASDVGAAPASHTHNVSEIIGYTPAGPEPTGGQSRYDTSIDGDGYTQEFTITHNLGIRNVIVTVIDQISGNTVIADVKRNSADELNVLFANPPELGIKYDVVVMG